MGSADPPFTASPAVVAKPFVQYDKQLSIGAVGSIWLARLAEGLELGRLVSVRRIPVPLVTDQTRERLRQTMRACLELRHPALLKLLAIREMDNEVLSISEHLQGVLLQDLKRFLIETQTPMPPPIAVRIIRDAARAGALARALAHEQRVFQGQRLLYDDAIVVAAFGETLLRDVGVFTELCQAPAIRENPAVIVGLSPEELSGPKVKQESSEVFSLGILLWELLTNRPAFSRRDAQKATSGVISQPVPPLDRVDRIGMPLPKELVAFVSRAIDRDPRRRTPSLDYFADAIDESMASYIGSTEQVGACIRRLASGFLGETEQSNRWSVGVQSDSFALDSGRGSTFAGQGSEFEPETVADRKLLADSMLEFKRRSELESQSDGTDVLDVQVVVEPPKTKYRWFIGLAVALLLTAVVAVGLYQFGLLRSWGASDRSYETKPGYERFDHR